MTDSLQSTLVRENPPTFQQVPANRWKGERGCIVGPFRAKNQAQIFEHYVLNRNGVATPYGAVREQADGWYITVPA